MRAYGGNLTTFLLVVLAVASTSNALDASRLRFHNAQSINFWKLQQHAAAGIATTIYSPTEGKTAPVQAGGGGESSSSSSFQAPLAVAPKFYAQTFTQPLDHFYNTTDATFPQRFWVNARHYKPRPGAPVILIDGGETSGEDRLPFLDTGIADILAQATGGIGVVLEHRYYGESIGVRNFSTDALRWLNNEQALEDSANFIRNVKFGGIKEDLTAPNTPWIYYGGSYAGARAAHMHILYPDLVFGAIASSAVTHAVLTNWEYMDVIRLAADPKCSSNLVNSITTIDSLLKIGPVRRSLKNLFGLGELESDQDFVSVLRYPLGWWQSRNWDPAVGSTNFDQFCATLNGDSDTARTVLLPGGLNVNVAVLNYAKWIRENVVTLCPQKASLTIEDCFGTNNDLIYQSTDLGEDWRLWTFQYCTQWGYLTVHCATEKYPAIISRLLDIDYEHKICKQAFPPGVHYSVPPLPNVTAVNSLGGYHIEADRLAFIDGEVDPWRPYTPHSTYGGAVERDDTLLRPFKIITGGVHHWDENGLRDVSQEPKEIRQIHDETIKFVISWLRDWEKHM
ncbi:peptidase S28 [Multifurca ochricompacta]|uniref:Peptidase S28 n=1 Tax=Multifurca ochricompacta TaxID=376703 RepID=A0AAD4LV70_9AGAM|nr:peptidase S28 [Multifurca ochricompacta]